MPAAHRDLPDEDLMLAYAGGDAAAFDVLYARHEAALYRFVRRLLGSALAAQADEVFQDAWLRIVAARGSFRPQGAAWRTWAFTIAHNLAMDRLRVSGREVLMDSDGDSDAPMEWLMARLDQAAPSSEDLAFWRAAALSFCTTRTAPAWKTWRNGCRCPSKRPRADCATRCASCAAAWARTSCRWRPLDDGVA